MHKSNTFAAALGPFWQKSSPAPFSAKNQIFA
jgi:hypothetical protein